MRCREWGATKRQYLFATFTGVSMLSSGFEVIASFTYAAFLLPLLAVSRLLMRIRPTEQDLDREVKLHPLVNAALLACSPAKSTLTQARLHWPAGGSRVVVTCAA
jgi:hypothetical protein